MADPLEEYLARKTAAQPEGGDPLEAYLQSKGVGGGLTPDRKAQLQAGIDKQKAKVAALNAEPDPMSLGEIAKNILPTTAALAERFNQGVSLGLMKPDAERAKLLNNGPGQFAGSFMGATGAGVGAPGIIYSKIAAPAAQAITNPFFQALARGGIAGGLTGGAQAAAEGAPLAEQGKAALTGAATGAAVDAAFTGLGAAGRAIREGAGGKARQLIEKYGGNVGPTTSGEGGAFDQELSGLPASDKGIGEASQRSGLRILDETDRLHQERVAEPYRQAKAVIDAGPGQKPVPVDDVYQAMMKAYQSPRLSVGQRGVIKSELDNLDQTYARPQLGIRIMTEEQLNDYKTMLNGLSKAGQAGAHTIPEAEIGHVAKLVRDKVNQGPYAQLNAQYHEGAGEKSDVRQALGLGPRESKNAMADATRIRNVLTRQTQDTTTAGATTMDLPQLKQGYPELERDMELPDLLGAKSTLNFHAGAPGHGGLISRLPPGIGLMGTTGMALAHQGAAASLLPIAAEFAARNSAPIAGRLLYSPAGGAEALGSANPLLRASIIQKLRDTKAAERLRAYLSGPGGGG